MRRNQNISGLRGQFLLAMPSIGDTRFARSVIYIIAHDVEGTMGFIVNQPAQGMTLGDVARNLPNQIAKTGLMNLPVYFGGPVGGDGGYVLHSDDYAPTASELTDGLPIHLTQSVDILNETSRGRGPRHLRLFLGYTGWGPGQLEDELQDNAWLVAPGDVDLLFSADYSNLYSGLLASLGIGLAILSNDGGEA